MVKLMIAKGYKLEVTVPVERTVKAEDPALMKKAAVADKKPAGKGAKGGKSKEATTPVAKTSAAPQQSYTHQVGNLTLELCLQRGEADVEIAREY